MEKTLVLFDFDGTLTKGDTFPKFIFHSVGTLKAIFGFSVFSPWIFLFIIKVINGSVLKEKLISYFFKGKSEEELKQNGNDFIIELLRTGLDAEMIKKVESYKAEKSAICIVSASLNIWIEPFCRHFGIEYLCTELEFINGVCTGKLKTQNCNHEEKAIRIKQKYDLSKFSKIIAYGNSSGDKAMFELATDPILV